jgi:hypothetical protein
MSQKPILNAHHSPVMFPLANPPDAVSDMWLCKWVTSKVDGLSSPIQIPISWGHDHHQFHDLNLIFPLKHGHGIWYDYMSWSTKSSTHHTLRFWIKLRCTMVHHP